MTKTAVRERPILFSAPMVRAILDGRKTETRRVVKLLPTVEHSHKLGPGQGWMLLDNGRFMAKCSHEVGDRLWVRETWQLVESDEGYGVCYAADGEIRKILWPPDYDSGDVYPPDHRKAIGVGKVINDVHDGPWRPSIFMPRWASRITLEVTQVRVERLQDISEADAVAEGATPVECSHESIILGTYKARFRFRDGFRALWDSINAKRGFGWDANPWVWKISFRRIQQ